MCEITYIDTICVQLVKNVYSTFKILTANKVKPPIIVGGYNNYILQVRIINISTFHLRK